MWTLTKLVDQYKRENHELAQKIKEMEESGYGQEREIAHQRKVQALAETIRSQEHAINTVNDEVRRLRECNAELQ